MEVGRLYNIDCKWYKLKRLWSMITVFDEYESEEGRKLTLGRLKSVRDDLNEVIEELEQEQEEESWLS